MKLKEFITNVFEEYGSSINNGLLYGKQLELFIPALQQLDEFKNCILKKVDYPILLSERMWRDNDNIEGIFYIYSIGLSPEMYPMNKPLNYRVKNDCGIGPLLYDPISLIPYKEIRMRINVSEYAAAGSDAGKNYYMKLLTDVLENPDEYAIKGEKRVMVRGDFKDVINLKK